MKHKLKWIQLPMNNRATALNNPYCGLFTLYKFFAHSEIVPELGYKIEQSVFRTDQSLCLVEIDLVEYNNCLLPEEALDRIERIFSLFTNNNREMIVRFLYDWDGEGLRNEPQNIEIILEHMRQLAPLLKKFTKNIYILQGLFIGSWGEMHNSRFLAERSLTRLAKQLFVCSGNDTYIAIRCPSIWRTIFKTTDPVDESQAFASDMKARFCLFNDSILASDTDNGTYGNVTRDKSAYYGDKLTRCDELKFQDKLCRYVPNGGEVVNVLGNSDFKNTCETLRQMHVSYLNGDYDLGVLNKWKEMQTGLNGKSWSSRNAYDYIVAHLGYRFSVESVRLSLTRKNENLLTVKIIIKNTGFSCSYRRFVVSLVARNALFSSEYVYPIETDTRLWAPDAKVELKVELNCSQWKQQEFILGLTVTDPMSGKHIMLSNTFSVADYCGIHKLGYVQISNY